MKSFGCLCYHTTPKPHRYKFNPRATPHVFIGYLFVTKGYRVLSLANNKIHVSRDVVFYDTIFPFSIITKAPSSLFYATLIINTNDHFDSCSHQLSHNYSYNVDISLPSRDN